MNKEYWHHLWTTWIRPVHVSYIAVALTASTIICVGALRANNVEMGKLRETVYTADKDNKDVAGALQNLQRFVTSHMNTDLAAASGSVYPPIQLKYTYQRLQDAANKAAAQANSGVYTQAQAYCEQQNSTDFSGRNRVPCIEQYVSSHGGAQAKTIPDSMYKFNFASPSWSPDLAGWSMVISFFFLALLIVRVLLGWVVPRLIK